MYELTIRPFHSGDAQPLSALISRSLHEVNGADYAADEIETLSQLYNGAYLSSLQSEGNLYVAELDGALAGCGGITPYWGDVSCAYILAVFTRPDCQGRGVGRAVMAAVEADPLFQSASRAELHASVTARGFYEKLGYAHIGGTPTLTDGCYPMEKRKAVP